MVRTIPLPPPRAPRRAVALPPEERRATIIQAALPLLAECGETVTTKQIADAAGIAEGTIFRVFPDKDALLVAAVRTALDPQAREAALAGIDLTLALPERLERAVVVLQRHVVDVWRLMSRVGSRFHEHLPRRHRDSEALVALLRADEAGLRVEPEVAARLLFGVVLASTHPMLVERPIEPAEIVALFLHGVATRPAC